MIGNVLTPATHVDKPHPDPERIAQMLVGSHFPAPVA
jgi:hypothetical protein